MKKNVFTLNLVMAVLFLLLAACSSSPPPPATPTESVSETAAEPTEAAEPAEEPAATEEVMSEPATDEAMAGGEKKDFTIGMMVIASVPALEVVRDSFKATLA